MATADIQTQAESAARLRKICVLMVLPPGPGPSMPGLADALKSTNSRTPLIYRNCRPFRANADRKDDAGR
jgi:hypothetical protein